MVGLSSRKRARADHLGPERRRPQVLDAALGIARKHGIRAVTMEAVADAIGVTKPVVYACYGSRDELVDELLAREEKRLLDGVMGALPQELDFADPDRMFREGFTALVRVVAEHPGSWQLVIGPEPDASVTKRYGHARRRVAARVAALMEVGFAQAGKEDAARKLPILVDLFMSAGDAAVAAMVRSRGAWTPEDLGAFMGRVVLAAIRSA